MTASTAGLSSLKAAILLALLAGAAAPRQPFQREGNEDDGEADITTVLMGGKGKPPAFIQALLDDLSPCDDPNCPACSALRARQQQKQDAATVGETPADCTADGVKLSPSTRAYALLIEAEQLLEKAVPAAADTAAAGFTFAARKQVQLARGLLNDAERR